MIAATKSAGSFGVSTSSGRAVAQVQADRSERSRADRDDAVASALALAHAHQFAGVVQVVQVEAAQLGAPESRGVQRLENRAVPQAERVAARRREQRPDFSFAVSTAFGNGWVRSPSFRCSAGSKSTTRRAASQRKKDRSTEASAASVFTLSDVASARL